jgi:hypothetical protein
MSQGCFFCENLWSESSGGWGADRQFLLPRCTMHLKLPRSPEQTPSSVVVGSWERTYLTVILTVEV